MSCLDESQSECILMWSVLYIQYSFFSVQSINIKFFETGWDLKKKKKSDDIHRLSNFYNWLFICILYQWSFLYWKLKEKNLYWKKKLSGLSMWPRLDQVLSLASLWCQAIFFLFVCFLLLPLKDAWFWFYLDLYMFLTSLISFSFLGGLGSSKSW